MSSIVHIKICVFHKHTSLCLTKVIPQTYVTSGSSLNLGQLEINLSINRDFRDSNLVFKLKVLVH